jgi:hypothetical protein
MALIVLGLRYDLSTARIARAVERPHRSVVRIGHASPIQIPRAELPYWQERGWKRDGRQYRGTFQTRFGSYTGLVEDRAFGEIRFLIHHPPTELKDSGHWPCFQSKGDGWYAVHMRIPPEDVSSGIIGIERLITSAFEAKWSINGH